MKAILQQGGPILWVIAVCGLAALAVFIERSLHLHRARIKFEDFLKGIFNVLRRNHVAEALAICEDTPGPVAFVVRTAILHRDRSMPEIQTALHDAMVREVSRMERRLVVIATVAQIAPLLGLLGTVLGLVDSLLWLQADLPLIRSADLMNGLMKSLACTAGGLMVAIPCHAAFNLLVIKIDRLVLDMEQAAAESILFLTGSPPPTPLESSHASSLAQ